MFEKKKQQQTIAIIVSGNGPKSREILKVQAFQSKYLKLFFYPKVSAIYMLNNSDNKDTTFVSDTI